MTYISHLATCALNRKLQYNSTELMLVFPNSQGEKENLCIIQSRFRYSDHCETKANRISHNNKNKTS
uniref:Uncharacterized protein n=1 Tax=Arundo donax TaxID=35708 RepID=A0A0A9GYN6_ARUDO